MAGDWIPMRMDLADDPAVVTICAKTGLDPYGVVGRLHKLWCWANRHLQTGHARGVTEKWVDEFLQCDGFSAAIISAGWLESETSGITFPKFDEWNSNGSKRRLIATKRQQKKRNNCHAHVTQMSRTERDKSVTREEKRREEKRREENTFATAPPTPVPVESPKQPTKPAKAPKKPDPLFDAVAEVTGSDPVVSGSHVGKIRALLAKAEPPYTPEEVHEFGRRFGELCSYARDENRRPNLGEVEKYIGKVRAPPPNVHPSNSARPTQMPSAEKVLEIMNSWRPPTNAPVA